MAAELQPGQIFLPFRIAGKQYLAVGRGANVHVISDKGENLGAYMSIASFREYLKKGDSLVLGKCDLVVRNLS